MRMMRRLGLSSLVMVALVACGDDDSTDPIPETYNVALTGAAERPNPVTTTASGSAIVTVHSEDSIEYAINVNADSVLAGHFHAGDPTVSGPIMLFFFGGPVIGRVDGPFRSGFVTRQSTFTGIFTFDSLLTRIRAGTTYINVHTRKFPGGEIRGQVAP